MKNQSLTRRNAQQARSQHKVELMLEAAMQLLEVCEVDALTTNAVAAKAGVSIGTLYQYFGDKHALLDALVAREVDAMTAKIVASLKSGAPEAPGDHVREVVRAVSNAYGGRDRVHRLLMEYSSGKARGGRLAPFYAQLIDICMAGESGLTGGARRSLTAAEAFVLTHAVSGVVRTAAGSFDAPPMQEVEDALVKLVMGFASQMRAEG